MKDKMKLWSHRNLTLEGKILIVKTFGLSQIIYIMQTYDFDKDDLIIAERNMFQFLWSSPKNPNGIDRIRRAVMKGDYIEGGLKVTDLDCLNRSLKLRQYIRASTSKHEIAKIQNLLSERKRNSIEYEYHEITKDEPVTKIAQNTINIITDFNRRKYTQLAIEAEMEDKLLVEEMASIDIMTHLRRTNKIFHACIMKKLQKIGINSLGELIRNHETEINPDLSRTMKMILSVFPNNYVEIAEKFNEDTNNEEDTLKILRLSNNNWKNLTTITTKEFQQILKLAMNKVEKMNFPNRLEIVNFEESGIIRLRQNCKNPKLRNIYFRLIHKDFYTHERMKRFRMVETNECPRCNLVEDQKHLTFTCLHARMMWKLYNDFVTSLNFLNENVTEYEQVFRVPERSELTIIKIKLIQKMIQIERPTFWTNSELASMIKEITNIEKYNAIVAKSLTKFEQKWGRITTWVNDIN